VEQIILKITVDAVRIFPYIVIIETGAKQMVEKLYRDSVKALMPSRAEMQRRHARQNAINAAGKEIALHRLETTGKTAMELYREACAARHENETEMERATRVALLGMARKEQSK
jgi:hypothetical protein